MASKQAAQYFDKFTKLLKHEKELEALNASVHSGKKFFCAFDSSYHLLKIIVGVHLLLLAFMYTTPYLLIDNINDFFTQTNIYYHEKWGQISQLQIFSDIKLKAPLSYDSTIEEIFFKMRGFEFADKTISFYQNMSAFFNFALGLFIMNRLTKLKKFFSDNYESVIILNVFILFFSVFFVIRGIVLYTVDDFNINKFIDGTEFFMSLFMFCILFVYMFGKRQKYKALNNTKIKFKFRDKDYTKLENDIEKIKNEKNNFINNIMNDKDALNEILKDAKSMHFNEEHYMTYKRFFDLYNQKSKLIETFKYSLSEFERQLLKDNKKTLKIRNE